MAGYIYLVQMDIPPELEEDFNRIYDTQHVPNILTVPGVSSCTRYRVESGDVEGVATIRRRLRDRLARPAHLRRVEDRLGQGRLDNAYSPQRNQPHPRRVQAHRVVD